MKVYPSPNPAELTPEQIITTVEEKRKKMKTYEAHIKELRDKATQQAIYGIGANFNKFIYGIGKGGSRYVGSKGKRKNRKRGK